jgi:NAD+ synthase (glutamine-hydrolysing)
MDEGMKIALAQLNTTVGDLQGNARKTLEFLRKAERAGADLCIFPEMTITGYPPRDLLLNENFIADNLKILDGLAGEVRDTAAVVGYADRSLPTVGKGLYNAGALIHKGKIVTRFQKMLLPTYDVFDEERYFDPADQVTIAEYGGRRIGFSICEDIWNEPDFWKRRFYTLNPVEMLVKKGAQILVNISASPFVIGRSSVRYDMLQRISAKYRIPVYYVNQVGGNDQLIFDGCSMAMSGEGKLAGVGKLFEEDLLLVDDAAPRPAPHWKEPAEVQTAYRALVLGLRDYASKCGFDEAVIGLSGGIDSSVVACIAVEALGRTKVHGIAMPSPYSSAESIEDARMLAQNLGIDSAVVPITDIYNAYLGTLKSCFHDSALGVTEENIQARIRGNILMAFSNRFGYLVLSTGNKSESAVGYCTLYGDMTGGLAVISDAPKHLVYDLARYINREKELIPRRVFQKPPSAELRPGQKDEDSLPPYPLLDDIVSRHIEKHQTPGEIIAAGLDERIVRDVVRRIERNEYKRQQAPPGLKISSKAFGSGRRIPLAQRYY